MPIARLRPPSQILRSRSDRSYQRKIWSAYRTALQQPTQQRSTRRSTWNQPTGSEICDCAFCFFLICKTGSPCQSALGKSESRSIHREDPDLTGSLIFFVGLVLLVPYAQLPSNNGGKGAILIVKLALIIASRLLECRQAIN